MKGKTYNKQNAWDGVVRIGVAQTDAGGFVAHWQTTGGHREPVSPELIPVASDPQAAQVLLDTWASEHQLQEAS